MAEFGTWRTFRQLNRFSKMHEPPEDMRRGNWVSMRLYRVRSPLRLFLESANDGAMPEAHTVGARLTRAIYAGSIAVLAVRHGLRPYLRDSESIEEPPRELLPLHLPTVHAGLDPQMRPLVKPGAWSVSQEMQLRFGLTTAQIAEYGGNIVRGMQQEPQLRLCLVDKIGRAVPVDMRTESLP